MKTLIALKSILVSDVKVFGTFHNLLQILYFVIVDKFRICNTGSVIIYIYNYLQ